MQILICGCSWANGAELSQGEVPFGLLVSNALDAKCVHLAQDAASIPHMLLQLHAGIRQLDKGTTNKALFLLTSPDRDLMWSCTRPIGIGHVQKNPPPYVTAQPIFLNGNDPLHRDWFMNYHSSELAHYRANVTILALQAICRHHDIEDYYAWAFEKVALWPEICTQRFYQQGVKTMQDAEFLANKKNYKITHPDQAQHRLLAERFLHMIQNQ